MGRVGHVGLGGGKIVVVGVAYGVGWGQIVVVGVAYRRGGAYTEQEWL